MAKVTLELPDDLADRAKEAGLLGGPPLVAVLQDALRRRAAERALGLTSRVKESKEPMSEEDVRRFVEETIEEVRRAR
jgi:hypothetical protein